MLMATAPVRRGSQAASRSAGSASCRALGAGQRCLGADLTDRFAAQWPQDVAGLVHLDPTSITPHSLPNGVGVIDETRRRGHAFLVSSVDASLRPRSFGSGVRGGGVPSGGTVLAGQGHY